MVAVVDQIEALLDEVRLLFHRAAEVASELHGAEQVSVGMRAVLEVVHRAGPLSVPDVARRRHVSRQHVQTLVNALLARELVTAEENPAHRRSPLISLTPAGART